MLSREAELFLHEFRPRGIDLSAESIVEIRELNRRNYEPGSRRALAEDGVAIEEIVLGGVPCLEARRMDGDAGFTLFFCHGGAMVSGSPHEDLPIIAALARHARARVVSPRYRLAPECPYPSGLDDVTAAYRALGRLHAVTELAVAGESAGGNLAAAMMHRLSPGERPTALALLSPWADFELKGDSIAFNAGRDPTLTPAYLRSAVQLYFGETRGPRRAASPAAFDYADPFPPTLISTGTRDLLLSDSVRLAQALRHAGTQVDLAVWDGLWHVFEFYREIPEATASLKQIAAFLKRHSVARR